MEPSDLEQYTLSEWLISVFFENNDKPFQVIYDRHELLRTFFEKQIGQHDRYKILMIEASSSPTEFISRVQIVEDFIPEKGWYEHDWIIYVHGLHADEVETFKSFLYYSWIGKTYSLNSFLDLLIYGAMGLIDTKQDDSILEEYLEYNKDLVNLLLYVPLSCFISQKQKYSEAASWMMILALKLPFLTRDGDYSPIWNYCLNRKKSFDVQSVILEMIYRYDPRHLENLDSDSQKLANFFLRYIGKELNYSRFIKSGSDFHETLRNFLKVLVSFGVPRKSKKQKTQKAKSLGSFIGVRGDEKPDAASRKILAAVMSEWTSRSDRILIERYQAWMESLRRDEIEPALSLDNLNEYLVKFSFTGNVDLNVMTFLLEKINDFANSGKEWVNKIGAIIEKRQKIWEKHAKPWWSQQKLFVSQNSLVSLAESWNFMKYLGALHFHAIPDGKEWSSLENIAWEIESCNNEINKPNVLQILQSDDIFASMNKKFFQMKQKHNELSQKLNELFSKFHSINFTSKTQNSMSDQGKIILEKCLEHLRNDERVAIIFCDALRRDFATRLKELLELRFEQEKTRIETSQIEEYTCYSYLPSTTRMGWNAILRNDDALMYSPINAKGTLADVELAIRLADGNLKILATPGDRLERLKEILETSGKEIEIFDINLKNTRGSLKELRKILNKDERSWVSIVWFDKIDDHDLDITQFYSVIEEYLGELTHLCFKFHEMGIMHVYVFTDHGFIFGNNDDVLTNVPVGSVEKRYCISRQNFSEEERKKYKEWNFFDHRKHGIGLRKEIGDEFSIITPKSRSLFKKARRGNFLLTHGGLSYQECSLEFLGIHCTLRPSVQIASIRCINETSRDLEGNEVFILKEMENARYLEIELKTLEEKRGAKKFQPISIKITADDNRIKIDPNLEIKLKSGEIRSFKLSFNKEHPIKNIGIKIIDSKNDIIATKEFPVTEPSIYGNGDLF